MRILPPKSPQWSSSFIQQAKKISVVFCFELKLFQIFCPAKIWSRTFSLTKPMQLQTVKEYLIWDTNKVLPPSLEHMAKCDKQQRCTKIASGMTVMVRLYISREDSYTSLLVHSYPSFHWSLAASSATKISYSSAAYFSQSETSWLSPSPS